MDRLGGVAALDDHVRVLEAGLGVALPECDDLGDVGRLGRLRIDAGGEHVGVQDRRVRGHCGLHVDDVRQDFIRHVDQRECGVGDGLRRGSDRRQRMTLVKHFLPRHAVQGKVTEIQNRLP
ncbi:MAG: hypothetical protein ABSC06_39720 [Rhodopila sp.]